MLGALLCRNPTAAATAAAACRATAARSASSCMATASSSSAWSSPAASISSYAFSSPSSSCAAHPSHARAIPLTAPLPRNSNASYSSQKETQSSRRCAGSSTAKTTSLTPSMFARGFFSGSPVAAAAASATTSTAAGTRSASTTTTTASTGTGAGAGGSANLPLQAQPPKLTPANQVLKPGYWASTVTFRVPDIDRFMVMEENPFWDCANDRVFCFCLPTHPCIDCERSADAQSTHAGRRGHGGS